MRMPGMDGWQLLAEVKRRHPEVIRLILSGYADPTSTMRSIGTAHQYVAKPCDSDTLKLAIKKALSLRELLSSADLARVVGNVELLPSTPQVFQELLTCLQQPNVVVADAARVMSRDVAMTANILKLVNSAFFGVRQSITRVDRAIAYLGLDTVGALVLAHSIFMQHEVSRAAGAHIAGLWTHSLQTATAASRIALCEQLSTSVAEEAFLAGLLHDVGKLILALQSNNPLGEPDGTDAEDARTALHAEVGAYLLGLWGFPNSIVEGVALHHRPSRSADPGLGLAGLVNVADSLAHADESKIELRYLEDRGLLHKLPAWHMAAAPTTPEHAARTDVERAD
jgi:putative nucleotidyltransferase with HDIG domain